jgi:hypothetical protein
VSHDRAAVTDRPRSVSDRQAHTRGTTVVWRNVDGLAEPHTVTASPGQAISFDSDWLLSDEQFQFTFTERRRFVYVGRGHGEGDSSMPFGMAGTIIVDQGWASRDAGVTHRDWTTGLE